MTPDKFDEIRKELSEIYTEPCPLAKWFYSVRRNDVFKECEINDDDILERKLMFSQEHKDRYKRCLRKYAENNRIPVEILEQIKDKKIGSLGSLSILVDGKNNIDKVVIDSDSESESGEESSGESEQENFKLDFIPLSYDNTITNAFQAKRESGEPNKLVINKDTEFNLSDFPVYASEKRFFRRKNKKGILTILRDPSIHFRVDNEYYYPKLTRPGAFEYLPDYKIFSEKLIEYEAVAAGSSCMHYLEDNPNWQYGDIDIFSFKTKLLKWILGHFKIKSINICNFVSTFLSVRIFIDFEDKEYEINYIFCFGEENNDKTHRYYKSPDKIKKMLLDSVDFNNDREDLGVEAIKTYIGTSFDLSVCCTIHDGRQLIYTNHTKNMEGVIYTNSFRRNTTLKRIRRYQARGYRFTTFDEKSDILDLICEVDRG